MREIHCWGAHLMVIDLARQNASCFYDRLLQQPPREFNWIIWRYSFGFNHADEILPVIFCRISWRFGRSPSVQMAGATPFVGAAGPGSQIF